MANRHLARSVVVQTLFEWDFRGNSLAEAEEMVVRNAHEFSPNAGDAGVSFMRVLTKGAIEKQKTLDNVIERAAPDWPIDRIAPVDRAVLRLGLYELLFGDHKDVPPKVAINEAIELAKTFGGAPSGRFVNGVLGAVYKELGEPGKHDIGKRHKRPKDVPYEKMPVERLVGAVVYARSGGGVKLAFVHDIFGHWTLSKGKLEEDEDMEVGTKRKIKEELGVDVEIKEKLGFNEYIANDPEIGKKRKQVNYFLAEAPFGELTLGASGGLDDAKWFTIEEAKKLNAYDDIKSIINKGIELLSSNTTPIHE